MSSADLVEQLEKKVQMLQYDLRQTRINQKSEITRLRNQVRKYKHEIKHAYDLMVHESWCDQRFYDDCCNCMNSPAYYALQELVRGKDAGKQTD